MNYRLLLLKYMEHIEFIDDDDRTFLTDNFRWTKVFTKEEWNQLKLLDIGLKTFIRKQKAKRT